MLNKNELIFYTKDGKKLDTLLKHVLYIKKIAGEIRIINL